MTPIPPEHWQARANEARTQADQMSDPTARQSMLQIAESYERMARRAAELFKSETPPDA